MVKGSECKRRKGIKKSKKEKETEGRKKNVGEK
jgi:hypothetical protein